MTMTSSAIICSGRVSVTGATIMRRRYTDRVVLCIRPQAGSVSRRGLTRAGVTNALVGLIWSA